MTNLLLKALFAIGSMLSLSGCHHLAVLDPKGVIALGEKHLLVTAVALMLIVVIPVIVITFLVIWNYRSSNKNATYQPNWAHSTILEVVWWTIPCIIITVLAVLTWITTHHLDPYRPLEVKGKPVEIQVLALNWKWLFIYPAQHIATVNFVEIPINEPVRFYITSDGPMNSLQIPQLAGQIYAMAGMQTKLNIMATHLGDYRGLSTNFSGPGFAGMSFMTHVGTRQEFDTWVRVMQRSQNKLDLKKFNELSQPSENTPPQNFALAGKDDFFNLCMMKYMMPMNNMKM